LKARPLVIEGVPVANGNVDSLRSLLYALAPPGRVTVVTVAHDTGCPCVEQGEPSEACTCELVDVTLRSIPRSWSPT
jgi:hypothetical protein